VTSVLVTVLLASAGVLTCLLTRRQVAPAVPAARDALESLPVEPAPVEPEPEAEDVEVRLLDTLDLVELPALVWCPETQSARLNATTSAVLTALGVNCAGGEIPARHVATGEPVTGADLEALVEGGCNRMAIWIGSPDDHQVALEVTARPVREGERAILLVGHDVTAEHSAIQTRSDLVATLAHDMRSALTSTIGYVALVTDDPTLTRKHRDQLDIALRGVTQTLQLMADLRAAREPGREAVRLSVTPAECDLAALLGDALTSLRPAARRRHIAVSVQSPDTVVMVADPVRMRQVLDNVLLNAVKHNQTDGWVDIQVKVAAKGVTVTVTNSGATLKPGEQALVFDRYYRSEASRRCGTRGSGLGLHLVKEVVEQHGGSVRIASSTEFDTTTLTLELPLNVSLVPSPAATAAVSSEEVSGVDTDNAVPVTR
jgi:signal transduction histidine kinase